MIIGYGARVLPAASNPRVAAFRQRAGTTMTARPARIIAMPA